MAESNYKKQKRSGKFSFTLHLTGEYCKKIKHRLCYSGADRQQAL